MFARARATLAANECSEVDHRTLREDIDTVSVLVNKDVIQTCIVSVLRALLFVVARQQVVKYQCFSVISSKPVEGIP